MLLLRLRFENRVSSKIQSETRQTRMASDAALAYRINQET